MLSDVLILILYISSVACDHDNNITSRFDLKLLGFDVAILLVL